MKCKGASAFFILTCLRGESFTTYDKILHV